MTGCADLGRLYYSGLGVKKDPVRGFYLQDKACGGGYQGACASVGRAYLSGNGAGKDVGRAIQVLSSACDHSGGAEACFNVGDVFRTGQAGMVDMPRAVGFYRRACDGNYPRLPLPRHLVSPGNGVPKNPAMAANSSTRLALRLSGFMRARGSIRSLADAELDLRGLAQEAVQARLIPGLPVDGPRGDDGLAPTRRRVIAMGVTPR